MTNLVDLSLVVHVQMTPKMSSRPKTLIASLSLAGELLVVFGLVRAEMRVEVIGTEIRVLAVRTCVIPL